MDAAGDVRGIGDSGIAAAGTRSTVEDFGAESARARVRLDPLRDALLTDFGRATLRDRYLLPGESYQEMFARVASAYADDAAHAQRLYDYISRLWLMPATPVLSNGGTDRGLPISCFINETDDTLSGIQGLWNENTLLASRGGGIGSYWGNVRSMGEKIGLNGKSSGIMPFIKVMDSLTLAISQGCVDGRTDVLTEKGWVAFADLGPEHGRVAQVDGSGMISFVPVQEYHAYPYAGPMHHYTNTKGTIDHLVTPNHRMVVERIKTVDGERLWPGTYTVVESERCSPHRDNRFHVTGCAKAGSRAALTPFERFLIAYQADGATKPAGTSNGARSGEMIYAFRFKRARKVERFEALLAETGFAYTLNSYANGVHSFLVRVPVSFRLSKSFSDWIDLGAVDDRWCREFIEEMKHWDGNTNGLDTVRWDGVERENADWVCAVACLAGYKAYTKTENRPPPRRPLHKVHICTDRRTVSGDSVIKSTVDFEGTVYCVSVPSGMFLVRRNGRVIVTGNSLRRGSAATYLPVSHPEVEEFIEMRRPTGGDPNRRSLNLHHGLFVPDAFMRAVEAGEDWALVSPKDGSVVREVPARALWIRILTARIETGEPYLAFSDHVNRALAPHQRASGLCVKTSNLCVEIMLPTGRDHRGRERTAVCCLSSLNLETWDEWKDHPRLVEDALRFLDNVLQDFIDRAPPGMERAVYAARRERSVGLGVMGFHSFLQSRGVPFEGAAARAWNRRMFRRIRERADAASRVLAGERGACPDAAEHGVAERFSHKLAVAPTASISIIAGGTSPGIEPIAANVFLQKTLSGSFAVRNRHLQRLLAEKGMDREEVWSSITINKGSVQHLDFLSEHEKAVYRTAFELDQRWVVEHAADRTPHVCQSQSVNLFLPADVHKRDLHEIHMLAWRRGVKSLYYCRSLSIQRAEAGKDGMRPVPRAEARPPSQDAEYEACESCQ